MTLEQNKKLEEIREKTASRIPGGPSSNWVGYTIFLLSLIDQQAAEIEELKWDAERLNWLERRSYAMCVREAIDRTMQADSAMGSLTPELDRR